MTKDVKVTGRIPNSVRTQVSRSRKTRIRKTLKNKSIKKIKTPRVSNQPGIKQDHPDQKNTLVARKITGTPGITGTPNAEKRGILQVGGKRIKNKTAKKVRFNLESEGVQIGKFRNALRVKMKTAKAKSRHNRTQNRTLKNRKFKIRFSEENVKREENSVINNDMNLISRLKEFNKEVSSDMLIARV